MSAAPRPRAEEPGQLSAQTLAWLAERPAIRMLVRRVWDTLTELERAGHNPGALAALRAILLAHQPPTRSGRCRSCPRLGWRRWWRRPVFPCGVWMTTHFQLQGFFSDNARTPGAVAAHSGRDAGSRE
jgi:hypothetical protein